MRPEIQYVASADGTSIAFLVAGEGTPVVFLRPGAGHLELDWDNATYRSQFEWYASRFRLIIFDLRGTGLSTRGAVEHSLPRWLEDLDAVLTRAGGEECIILSTGASSALAVAAAHRWPRRVSRLVLWNPFSARDIAAVPGLAALRSLVESNWEIYTETFANLVYGWSAEVARARAAALRAAVTQDEMKALFVAMNAMEVEHLLPEIATPTLVILPREAHLGAPDSCRRIASRLPNARLASVPGAFVAMSFEDARRGRAIADFLGTSLDTAPPTAPAATHETTVILFTDIVDSTGLTECLGDDGFRARARDLDARLRALVRESGGTPVEGRLLGDGILALFASAREAIAGAFRCHEASAALGLPLHIGIHAGDVIREGGDVHGGAVNLAARVAAASGPGETLVTDTVRALARTSTPAVFEDRGPHALKGVADPQQLFAVRAPAV